MTNTTTRTPTPYRIGSTPTTIVRTGPDGQTIVVAVTETLGATQSYGQMCADARSIVKALNSRAHWAMWIVRRGPGLPDHACAECVPGGEIVKAGFQCVYHEAVAALAAAEAA